MGRYYSGDIEGKFWFGVQSSSDADFFGVEGNASYLEYYFDHDDIPSVDKGIKKCEFALGDNLKRLDEFFEKEGGYNNEMIIKFYKEKYNINITEQDIGKFLEWYARLALGKQILKCLVENEQCAFSAEL
jgi:hypothetical protein